MKTLTVRRFKDSNSKSQKTEELQGVKCTLFHFFVSGLDIQVRRKLKKTLQYRNTYPPLGLCTFLRD